MRNAFRSIFLSALLFGAFAPVGSAGAADAKPAGVKPVKVAFEAIVVEGAQPVKEKLAWTVSRTKAGAQTAEVVATQNAASPSFSLEPGRYLVTARYGDTEVSQPFAVDAGTKKGVVNLKAGSVNLKMIPYTGAPVVKKDIVWEVYQYSKDATADGKKGRKINTGASALQRFILPEGYYVVRALYSGTASELVVPVTAGHGYKYTVNLYAGKVNASVMLGKGSKLKEKITFEVVRATPNASGQRETVTTQSGKAPVFLLREGKYAVLARSGNAFIGEAPVDVKAGKTQNVKVVLKAVAQAVTPSGS